MAQLHLLVESADQGYGAASVFKTAHDNAESHYP